MKAANPYDTEIKRLGRLRKLFRRFGDIQCSLIELQQVMHLENSPTILPDIWNILLDIRDDLCDELALNSALDVAGGLKVVQDALTKTSKASNVPDTREHDSQSRNGRSWARPARMDPSHEVSNCLRHLHASVEQQAV